jgi:hypothetical protein
MKIFLFYYSMRKISSWNIYKSMIYTYIGILVRNYAKDRYKFCDFSLGNIPKINKKSDFYAMNQKKGFHRNMLSLRKAQRPCFKNHRRFVCDRL